MQFSKVECFIKPFKLGEVKEALIRFGVNGMTVCEVFGNQRQAPGTEGARGKGGRADLAPRLKIEMLLVRDQVSEVVELLAQAARTGNLGDGKILVSPIESIFRIRTGEQGIDAL